MLVEHIVHPTTPVEVKFTRKETDRKIAPDAAIVIFTACLVLATIAMFLLLTASAWKQKKIITTQLPDQIPCRSCRFFKENQYLKCAVHPASVLTQRAIDCQDYQPRNKPDT